jgi:hypothetical protein
MQEESNSVLLLQKFQSGIMHVSPKSTINFIARSTVLFV